MFTFLDFVAEQEDLVSSEHRAARLIHAGDLQVGGVGRLCRRNRFLSELSFCQRLQCGSFSASSSVTLFTLINKLVTSALNTSANTAHRYKVHCAQIS